MSTEQNKAGARRFYDEVLGQGKLDVIDEICAPGYVDHSRDNPTHDLAGAKQFVAGMRSSFPDISAKVEDMIAEGDRVVARLTVTGTHRGEFMGTAPTGKRFSIACIDIVRCADGKAVELWSEADDLGMLQQLGMSPAQTQG
ncbi:MAG: ester cyclase [Chloroflexi bacterium]|nr:ester cyclase [Chloroflexota bacterium]